MGSHGPWGTMGLICGKSWEMARKRANHMRVKAWYAVKSQGQKENSQKRQLDFHKLREIVGKYWM